MSAEVLWVRFFKFVNIRQGIIWTNKWTPIRLLLVEQSDLVHTVCYRDILKWTSRRYARLSLVVITIRCVGKKISVAGQMEELANWYEKRDHLYVETHAFLELQSTVEDMHWATVLGKPGDGKTFMAAHLMLKYRKRGFEPVFCNSADDWRSLVSCGSTERLPSKQFVIIDDMFGTSCVDSGKVGKWLSTIDNMTKILEERNHTECRLLIVCTSRRYIFSDVESALARFKTFHKFTLIDTTEDSYKLSQTEKNSIFRKYVNEHNIVEYKGREIEDIDPPHGFPHCVEMFCTNAFYRNNYGMAFFENPAENVQRELKNFRDNDRIKYLVLVLVLFHDNRLENAYFQELVANLSKRDKQLFNDTGVFLDTSYPDLMKSLEALHNTYLKKGPSDSYSFTHESIMENVAFVYMSSSPVHGIEALDFKYVLAFINSSFKNVVTVETDVLQEIVQLPVGYVKPLVTRATAELTRGNIVAVCSINAWCNSEFVSKWIDHICNTMTSHERISMFCRQEDQGWVWDYDVKLMPLFFHYRSARKRDMSGVVPIGGSVCMLSALVFLQRNNAVLSILNCPFLKREMNKSAICKEMFKNALELSCIYSQNQDIVKQLLTYQLDGPIALWFALQHGFVEYAKKIIRSSGLIPKYTDCRGTLHYLVASDVEINEFKDRCELLLEKGEDINLPNALGEPNLFALVTTIATNKMDLSRLHYFLHLGANINIRDQCGRNLVLHLIESQSSNVCLHFFAQLQETGLDFHACDDLKQNALHYLLTKQPDIDFGKLFTFLKSKVGVNIAQADYRGRVPLMLALQSVSGLEYVQELLPGSPHGHIDNQGQSYVHYLCGSQALYEHTGDSALFQIIARKSSYASISLFTINSSLSLHHIQCLHQNGCDIHAKDKHGRNIVQNVIMAAKIKKMQSDMDPLELLKYFHLNAVDFHSLDNQGRNAMHFALSGYSDVWPWHYEAAWNLSWSLKKPVDINLEEIIAFLKDTMEVNFYTQDRDGVSPLMLGLRFYPEMQSLKSLFKNQVQSQIDNKGRGYLHYLSRSDASREIFEEIFAMLLNGCIDINCTDTLGRSPMFYFSDYEIISRITFFIENGANINLQDKEGNTILLYLMDKTSLRYSCIPSIISKINLLDQKKADPHIQNKNKVSPVMKALERCPNLSCLKQWVQGTLPSIEDENGQNCFHYLARTRTAESVFIDLCNALLDNEVDINHEDNRGGTPLLECLHAGHLELVKLLVHFGADIHWQDMNRRNLLMFTFTSDLWWQSRPIIEYLATSGVDCFKQDSEGVNAFMLALSLIPGFMFVNQFVKGIIPDLTDLQGRTYIHYLARSDAYHPDFLGQLSGLLKNNIDINARDKLGRTPVFESVIKGQLVTLKVLVDNGADIYITDSHGVNLVLATFNEGFGIRCMAILRYLRKMGVRFDSLDDNGRNAMHYLFMTGANKSDYHAPGINRSFCNWINYSEVLTDIFYFLDKIDGVDIFQQDKQGINPLMLALQKYPYETCVKECVERKITKQEVSMGSTYFHYLVRSSCSATTFKAIASALVERGMDINGKDLLDRSPLFECFALGRTEEMDILVELGAKAEETDNWEKHPVIQKRLAHIKTTLQKAGLTLKDSDHEAGWSHNFYYLCIDRCI